MLSAKKQLKAPLLDEAPLSASASASASGRYAASFSTSKNSSSASDSDSSDNDSYPRRTSGFMDGMGFVHCLCFCLVSYCLMHCDCILDCSSYIHIVLSRRCSLLLMFCVTGNIGFVTMVFFHNICGIFSIQILWLQCGD
jgi:hypothetical protein